MALRAIKTECGTYTVQAGDTLASIAGAFHTTPAAIIRANRLGGMRIVIGQGLAIPGYCPTPSARGMQGMNESPWIIRNLVEGCLYYVQADDTPANVAAYFGTTIAAMRADSYNGPTFDQPWSITNSSGWFVGKRLRIPSRTCYGGIGGVGAGGYLGGTGGGVGGNVTGVDPSSLQTTVNPGDQVKVTLSVTRPAGTIANSNARASAVLAGMGYAVIGIDAGGGVSLGTGLMHGPAYVLVQATRTTTLSQVAADVNYALSSVGFGVDQSVGSIYANFYSRGNSPLAPGVPPGPGNPNANPLDDIAKALSDAFKVPLTAGVVVGILVVGALIFLKT